MSTNNNDFEFEACCLACGLVQPMRKNVHWHTCNNKEYGIAIKVNHAGTKQDLRDVEEAIKRLLTDDFEVLY
jgi:hypothetical protein